MNWKAILSNKYFVAATSAFGGALLTWGYNWVLSGSPALTWPKLEAALAGALGAAIVALYHLYLPQPTSTPK